MVDPYAQLLRPLLFRSAGGDAEVVHTRTLARLRFLAGSAAGRRVLGLLSAPPRSPVALAGIQFPGVLGLAAGMDKDGVALRAWAPLGFGHLELGTVTPRPQPGNSKPRLYRLPSSRALVNRMGFNNAGAPALAERLRAAGVRRGNGAAGLPVGVSIGKNADTPLANAAGDYLDCLRMLAPHADYLAVNVSSPNTPGLRTLQDAAALAELLTAVVREAAAVGGAGSGVPILVKIAPDLSDAALDDVIAAAEDSGVLGIIATNTTLARDGVAEPDAALAAEPGGLSGAPLAVRARQVVRYLTDHSALPVVGVGGITSPADAAALLDAGARLLQVYTGFVYGGPGLVRRVNQLPVPGGRGVLR